MQPYIYDVHMKGTGEVWGGGGCGVWDLKFVTCLQILVFLSNRSKERFCG